MRCRKLYRVDCYLIWKDSIESCEAQDWAVSIISGFPVDEDECCTDYFNVVGTCCVEKATGWHGDCLEECDLNCEKAPTTSPSETPTTPQTTSPTSNPTASYAPTLIPNQSPTSSLTLAPTPQNYDTCVNECDGNTSTIEDQYNEGTLFKDCHDTWDDTVLRCGCGEWSAYLGSGGIGDREDCCTDYYDLILDECCLTETTSWHTDCLQNCLLTYG